VKYKNTAIKAGVGVGINSGYREVGYGSVYSIGWQKSYGKKNKLRINPNLIVGGFEPLTITDTREHSFRISMICFNIHYDLIKYKIVSISASAGGFADYTRGVFWKGSWRDFDFKGSEYFHSMYAGGCASLGLRFNPENYGLAFEIRPFNFCMGSREFLLGYMMFGIDFKFRE